MQDGTRWSECHPPVGNASATRVNPSGVGMDCRCDPPVYVECMILFSSFGSFGFAMLVDVVDADVDVDGVGCKWPKCCWARETRCSCSIPAPAMTID